MLDLQQQGYTVEEVNTEKPWGAYVRLSNDDADRFVNEYFPDITPEEARFGHYDVELSPKILITAPNQRLSWQFHQHRAERWKFLTSGGYHKSTTDEEGELQLAEPGDVIQFAEQERHRLIGQTDGFTIVAEIWQHIDPHHPSNEDDIVRLQDDYER